MFILKNKHIDFSNDFKEMDKYTDRPSVDYAYFATILIMIVAY